MFPLFEILTLRLRLRTLSKDGLVGHQSMGGEALGPVKALCSSVGECQGQEIGVSGLVTRGRQEEIGDYQRGNQEGAEHLKCK